MRLGVEWALVDGALVRGDVAVEDGLVAAVGLEPPPGASTVAVAGLVDLQVNGVGDVDLMTAADDGWERAGAALLAAGVTAFQPTFVTAPESELAGCLGGLAARVRVSARGGAPCPRVLGAHLEGPFLHPDRLGAHDAASRRDPDPELLRRLLDAGPVRHVTLAPEMPGADELVEALVARGIVVAAGHTAATAEQAHAAFDRGVSVVTHLGNAMRPLSHGVPALADAALARSDVTVTVIADGEHLAAETLLTAWRAARGRCALVSDAAAPTLAGRAPAPGARLAGSRHTLLDGVRTLHGLGVPLAEAIGAATAVPARVAGRPELGDLVPGTPADVLVLDDRLDVVRVLADGRAIAAA
jgi:N-acetylglucosamine-6-phosphate deacetylase